MHKTEIKIRPFIPVLKDEKKDGREPFALLTYGGMTIEIDLTLLRSVTANNESPSFLKTTSIFSAAISEMEREMWSDIDGEVPKYHRDHEESSRHNENFTHNPLHKDNIGYITIK